MILLDIFQKYVSIRQQQNSSATGVIYNKAIRHIAKKKLRYFIGMVKNLIWLKGLCIWLLDQTVKIKLLVMVNLLLCSYILK